MGIDNLKAMFARADGIDYLEGQLAYVRYNYVMQSLAARWEFGLPEVVAAFVSLSPNSDYHGNLRSTVSVLAGIRNGIPLENIIVSTYNHCRDRAYAYACGAEDFLSKTKGPKITNFYHNLLDPGSNRWVTIDGHMTAIWRGEDDLTMREALVKGTTEYNEIALAIKQLAFYHHLLPNQLQAILWFTRKRVLNVRYDPQGELFGIENDRWKTIIDAANIEPYPMKVK